MPKSAGAVVHISDCYAPRTGGIETQVGSLVRAQQMAGLDVRVITATHGRVDSGIYRITAPIPFQLPVHPRTRDRVTKTLAEIDPAVVHIHLGATSPFAWGAMRACLNLGLPTVVTVHSMWGALSRTGYSTMLNNQVSARFQWSAVSEPAAELVEQSLRRPVSVLPNGIDLNFWTIAPSDADHLRLISVLRMAPRKRVFTLLKAFKRAQIEAHTIEMTLIGDGPLFTTEQMYAERHSIDVNFTGRQDQFQIREALGNADVFVQASIQESFGIAALEARAAGLAVIAREETGTRSFIRNGQDGFLVSSDVELSDRIAELAFNADLLRSMKSYSLNHRPPYDWNSVVDQAQALYDQAQQVC